MRTASIRLSLVLCITLLFRIIECTRVSRMSADGVLMDSGYRKTRNKLGTGGYCMVYEGFHVNDVNHKLALRGCKIDSPNRYEQFAKECRLHKSLEHENILKLIDCFEGAEGRFVFVVEYMAEGDLLSWLIKLQDSDICVPKYFVQHIFRELLNGIEYLHSNGIIHRDLKPGNILLGENGLVKISDFGIADKLNDNQSVFRGCYKCGSPGYMAPEMKSRFHTLSADLYSLGVILYELAICGPFPRDGYSATKTRIVASLMDQGTNPYLIELILGLIEKDPNNRMTIEQLRESSYVIDDIPSSI